MAESQTTVDAPGLGEQLLSVAEPSNIFTIFSPPDPVPSGYKAHSTGPKHGSLVSTTRRTVAVDDNLSTEPDAKQAASTLLSGQQLHVSQASDRTPSTRALSPVELTDTILISPSKVVRQLGGCLENEIDKQRREIDELRAETSEARSQAMLAKEQEAAAIDRADAQARATTEAEEACREAAAELVEALKEAELQGSARQEAMSELSELRAVRDAQHQIAELPMSPSQLSTLECSNIGPTTADNSEIDAANPLFVSTQKLASLQERVEALNEAQLIPSTIRESIEDSVADFVELRAGIGVDVTIEQVVSSPAAVAVRKIVALSEVARSEGVFARQLRRKLQLN